MAAWVSEEENASNQWQKKREAEEADKVEVAPGVTSKLETFSNRVDWANPRTTSIVPLVKLKPLEYGMW